MKNELARHIEETANILNGWTTGILVIEPGCLCVYDRDLDLEHEIDIAKDHVEVETVDGGWRKLKMMDYARKTKEGWLLFAGLDARMKKG
ncbi:hypothetical protein [Tindallia californiensis]|uniref:Uncharacterized protein n=1 Tax=Tindallia californiensis TaxID=159292 RepID=A0A1H3R1T1_9FIRM|nr:hypothetical protein [Tindallia californiensis]SDZ18909.1 hypothetical protein SAMN05192546_11153 [Tindallia californiensis]